MSEEENGWSQYLNKVVIIQLREQPLIGITGESLDPITNHMIDPSLKDSPVEYASQPFVRGTVTKVWRDGEDTLLELQSNDPNPGFPDNKVSTLISARRDVGYLTTIEASRIAVAQ